MVDVDSYVWALYFVKTLMKWRIPKIVTLSVETFVFFLNSYLIFTNLSRPSVFVLNWEGRSPIPTSVRPPHFTPATSGNTHTLPRKRAFRSLVLASLPSASCHRHCGGKKELNFTNKDNNSPPTCMTRGRPGSKSIQNGIHVVLRYRIWAIYTLYLVRYIIRLFYWCFKNKFVFLKCQTCQPHFY